ncbi:MAG: hypothetical protein PHQ32_03900 [Firmicutes bacterium]|nr:hypothetical protein [Bacillota bacterium]
MRLLKSERGSFTIFMAILMPVVVLFLGVVVDVVRVKYYKSLVNEGLYSSVDSVLADYDKGLYESYGIFAIRDKEYGLDFSSMVRNNLKEKDIELGNFSLSLISPLSDSRVLKAQILEDMKVRGLVNLGKDVYGIVSAMKEVDSLGGDYGEFGGSREESITKLQDKVASNMEVIKDLEERRAGGEAGLDGVIEGLYGENKSMLDMSEDLSNNNNNNSDNNSNDNKKNNNNNEFGEDTWANLTNLFGDDLSEIEGELKNPGFVFFRAKSVGGGIREKLGVGLENLRDDLLVGEYVLERFSNLSSGSGEVERIVGNGSTVGTLFNMLLFRTFLDGVGYFCLDAKAPPELVSRLVYSVVMGLGTGVSDMVTMVGVSEARVPVVNMVGVVNPVDFLRLSYRDHLLLFSLLAGEEVMLRGVYEGVMGSFPYSYFCGARGSLRVKVPLLFLKFLPEGCGLFGGVVRGGDFVFEESVSLSFN